MKRRQQANLPESPVSSANPSRMTPRERAYAVLEGRPVDRFPVACLYEGLYQQDHFAELTGQPQWQWRQWLCADPEEHLQTFRRIHREVPFEILQPHSAPPLAERERQEFAVKDGRPCRYDRDRDCWRPLDQPTRSGHAFDTHANETQHVRDRRDIDRAVHTEKAEDAIAAGVNDYIAAVAAGFGDDHFVLSGGVVGTIYACEAYTGLTNLFAMMLEQPRLIDYLTSKILERNIERIRRYAAAGGDAIYIDDAMAGSDMISLAHYERFALPHMQAMVREIHNLGHKAIVIYFGGVADRLDQIASIGADALLMEASMKHYVNDIGATVDAIGQRVTLFANIDPVGILQNGSDTQLQAEIQRQTEAGARGRGFVISPSSPITPSTPLARVQRFIQLSRQIGAAAHG